MSKRVLTYGLLLLAVTSGDAAASSFVTFGDEEPVSTPSFVQLGFPESVKIADIEAPRLQQKAALDPSQQALLTITPGSWASSSWASGNWQAASIAEAELADTPTIISPSIIALGEPLPEVSYEEVAAVPTMANRDPLFSPMVIRGGLVDEVISAPSAPSVPSRRPAQAVEPIRPTLVSQPVAPSVASSLRRSQDADAPKQDERPANLPPPPTAPVLVERPAPAKAE